MTENIDRGTVEAEIAALSQQIEDRRRLLGAEHGIVEERDLVHHVIGEQIGEQIGVAASAAAAAADPTTASGGTSPSSSKGGPTYLDNLDDETVEKINKLVSELFEVGISKTIKKVVEEDPFVLDAFHDALVDKLYDELKKHKVVS